MGVLDLDDGTPPQVVLEKLHGLKYLAHSTWSPSNESPNYRVIIPFGKPVPGKEWESYWTRLNTLVGNHNDKQVKDPSRIYYTPSHPKGSDEPFVLVGEGEYLDPESLPVSEEVTASAVVQPEIPIPSRDSELNAVLSRCRFMQWASDPANQANVAEPLWWPMVSNAARFAEEEWIHKASEHHPDYDQDKTNKKIEATIKYGPITCKRIQESGFKGCPAGGCKLPNNKPTKSPAGLCVWTDRDAEVAPQI